MQERGRNGLEVDPPLFVGDRIRVHVHVLIAELPPALVAVHDGHALDIVVSELAFEFRAIVIEPLEGRLDADFVVIAAEGDRALGLPRVPPWLC